MDKICAKKQNTPGGMAKKATLPGADTNDAAEKGQKKSSAHHRNVGEKALQGIKDETCLLILLC